MPAGDPVDEDGADLITPSAQIFSSNSTLASAITAAASTVKANLPKIDVASEIGTVSEAVRKEFDKQDAIIKAKLYISIDKFFISSYLHKNHLP